MTSRTIPPAADAVDGATRSIGAEDARTTSGAPPASAPHATTTRQDARRRRPHTLIGIAVLAAAAIGLGVWWTGRHRVSTDNAHVEGHITPVLARVAGYVTTIHVEDNQRVRAGETLVVLDDRDARARLAAAEAELVAALADAGQEGQSGQAQARLAAARAAAAAADAAVARARSDFERAQADLQRYRPLAADAIVSRQQLDAAEAAAQIARAQLTAAERNARAAAQEVEVAAAGLDAARARVTAARAARDQAALQLSYTRITAPVSGVVSRVSVEQGQLVQPGQPLMSVVPLDDIWVVANLKETEIREVHPGATAEVEVDAYPGRSFPGRVESLSAATGSEFALLPPDNATGNFTKVVQWIPVRIRLIQPQDTAAILRPGMNAVVTIRTP
ncbi:MAG TPA: HlyD family secretion protein [Longimicrobiales bacterium]